MGFKLPGKSIHSGTSSHRSAVKMYKDAAPKMYDDSPTDMALKGDQHKLPQHLQDGIEAAPEPGDSPNKYFPIAVRAAGTLAKHGSKVAKYARTGMGNITKRGSTVTFKPNILGKIKGVYDKTPKVIKNFVKHGAIYAGIDAGINMLTGDGDKKSNKTATKVETTTPKTKKKSGPSPYARAKKNDPNLDSYIAGRKKHKKGSAEYNAFQNKINLAYGDKTRHGVESSSSTKGRKTTSSMNVPGISNTKTVSKSRRSGKKKVDKVTNMNTGVTTKTKYNRKGEAKKIVTKKDGMRTVTKKNRKGEIKTKTRKTLNPFD